MRFAHRFVGRLHWKALYHYRTGGHCAAAAPTAATATSAAAILSPAVPVTIVVIVVVPAPDISAVAGAVRAVPLSVDTVLLRHVTTCSSRE